MRRRFTLAFAAVTAAALLLAGAPAFAQDDDEDYYEGERDNIALAIGIGLVEPANEVETYYMAALRFRAGRDDGSRGRRLGSGIDGYLEPEVGYWENSNGASDLLLGVNLIGVLPLGGVDSFFGVGAGAHWIDAELLGLPGDDSETKLGANAQFGIDLHMSESWSVFGAGRFDLVQEAADDIQGKIYLGLRGRW